MATHFEVRFRHDRHLLRTTLRATRSGWRMLYGVYAALTGTAIVFELAQGAVPSAATVAFFAGFAIVAYNASPRVLARRMERMHRKRFGGELPEVEARFSDEDIRLNECRNEEHFDYAQVERILVREGIRLLVVTGRMVIPLPDAGFAQGTPQAFDAFIREKCPQAKVKRKRNRR